MADRFLQKQSWIIRILALNSSKSAQKNTKIRKESLINPSVYIGKTNLGM